MDHSQQQETAQQQIKVAICSIYHLGHAVSKASMTQSTDRLSLQVDRFERKPSDHYQQVNLA